MVGAARSLDLYVPAMVRRWLAERPGETVGAVDGTLVFADVSGFTPLTERLARRGKVGAEVLTDILNDLFGHLLDTAAMYGGDLLKFGGDALLLAFPGDDHCRRACAAAAAMQAELKQRSRVDTGTGIVVLKMSVGVHSARFPAFLLGSSHRELLVCGEPVRDLLAMETAASAGEILISGATAAGLPADWLGVDRAGGRLLRAGRARLDPGTPTTKTFTSDSTIGVPLALRDHLRQAPELGEHRRACVAFVQFTGMTALLEQHDVDSVGRALGALIDLINEACARHGVTFIAADVDSDGGKFLLCTGVPQASGDDEERMLFAAREIVAWEGPLELRSGVNRGHLFAVDVGSATRRSYSVLGDVVNLAARVMGKAPVGGVLATDDALHALRTDFELDRLEPFMVKGKSMPVHAATVGAPVGARRQATSASALLGRDVESEQLGAALANGRTGQAQAVVLVGEPGLGKSRMVEELLDRGADLPRVVIEGGPYAAFSPYFVLRAPLRRLLGLDGSDPRHLTEALTAVVGGHDPALLPWLPLIGVVLGIDIAPTAEVTRLDEKFRRARLQDAVFDLLQHVLPSAALIVVEDAHWLDDATGALVTDLLSKLDRIAWTVCITRRNEATGLVPEAGERVELVPLQPLTADDAERLILTAADEHSLAPSVVSAIAERGAGNPLFLHELLAVARAGGDVESLPDSIEAVIATRIDTLPVIHRALLRHASVLGARFSTTQLEALVDDAVVVDVREAVNEHLAGFLTLQGNDEIRFRHALIRQVAYEGLPYRRRRALHERAGLLIEGSNKPGVEAPLALLSLHFFYAQRFDRAWTYSLRAAEKAERDAAFHDAVSLYERALDSARRLSGVSSREIAAVHEQQGDAAHRAGMYEIAVRAFAHARGLNRDAPDALAPVLCKDGTLRVAYGKLSEAVKWFTRGLHVAPDGANEVRAALLIGKAGARVRQGRYEEGIALARLAEQVADEANDRRSLARAYYLLDFALTDTGHPDRFVYRGRALPICEELEDFTTQANALNNLGTAAYYEGRWNEAVRFYERSRAARKTSGDVVLVGEASNNIAEVLSDQGHLAAAEDLFRDALRLWRGTSYPVGTALVTSNLGRVAARSGRFDEAAELYVDARSQFAAIGAGRLLLEADAREAERLVSMLASDAALALVERVEDQLRKLGGIPVLSAMLDRIAGLAYLQRRDLSAASERLHASLEGARTAGASFELAQSLTVLARLYLETGADPTKELDEARGILGQLGVVSLTCFPIRAHAMADPTHTVR